MSPTASTFLLALFSFLGSCPGSSEAYLMKTWSAQDLALLGVSAYGSKCHVIPTNMTLCHGIGYDRMFLPNHLNHDTMAEAITQSQAWVALTRTACHTDLRVFLCSLYAPVCLSEATKLFPCKQLCENVRNGCLPRMRAVGYEWPRILRCDQFPTSGQLCVPPRENKRGIDKCPPCKQALTYENIISSFCMSSIAFKAHSVSYSIEGNRVIKYLVGIKRKFFKSANLSNHEQKYIEVYSNIQEECRCAAVDKAGSNTRYLLMGQLDSNRKMELTFIMKFHRRRRTFRRAMRKIRVNKNICKIRLRGRNNDRKKKKKKKKRKKRRRNRDRNRRPRQRRPNRRRNRGRRRRIQETSPQNPAPANATLLSQV